MLQLETPVASCRYELDRDLWVVTVKHNGAEQLIGRLVAHIEAKNAVELLNVLFNLPSKAPPPPEASGLPKPWLDACALAAGLKLSDHPWAGANDTPLEVRVVDLEAQVAALDGRLGCVEQFIKTL